MNKLMLCIVSLFMLSACREHDRVQVSTGGIPTTSEFITEVYNCKIYRLRIDDSNIPTLYLSKCADVNNSSVDWQYWKNGNTTLATDIEKSIKRKQSNCKMKDVKNY